MKKLGMIFTIISTRVVVISIIAMIVCKFTIFDRATTLEPVSPDGEKVTKGYILFLGYFLCGGEGIILGVIGLAISIPVWVIGTRHIKKSVHK